MTGIASHSYPVLLHVCTVGITANLSASPGAISEEDKENCTILEEEKALEAPVKVRRRLQSSTLQVRQGRGGGLCRGYWGLAVVSPNGVTLGQVKCLVGWIWIIW